MPLFVQLIEKRLGQVEHPPGHTRHPLHPLLPGHPRQPALVIRPHGLPGLPEHPRHIGILSKVLQNIRLLSCEQGNRYIPISKSIK